MTDIEGFLAIYGHSDNLLNNKYVCMYVCMYLNEVFHLKTKNDIVTHSEYIIPIRTSRLSSV